MGGTLCREYRQRGSRQRSGPTRLRRRNPPVGDGRAPASLGVRADVIQPDPPTIDERQSARASFVAEASGRRVSPPTRRSGLPISWSASFGYSARDVDATNSAISSGAADRPVASARGSRWTAE